MADQWEQEELADEHRGARAERVPAVEGGGEAGVVAEGAAEQREGHTHQEAGDEDAGDGDGEVGELVGGDGLVHAAPHAAPHAGIQFIRERAPHAGGHERDEQREHRGERDEDLERAVESQLVAMFVQWPRHARHRMRDRAAGEAARGEAGEEVADDEAEGEAGGAELVGEDAEPRNLVAEADEAGEAVEGVDGFVCGLRHVGSYIAGPVGDAPETTLLTRLAAAVYHPRPVARQAADADAVMQPSRGACACLEECWSGDFPNHTPSHTPSHTEAHGEARGVPPAGGADGGDLVRGRG